MLKSGGFKVRKYGMQIGNQHARKWFYNQNYFKKIDTQDKAYWLGFITGDGYREFQGGKYSPRLGIGLSQVDTNHLRTFIRCLDGKEEQIKFYKNNGRGKALLRIDSKQIVLDLENTGTFLRHRNFKSGVLGLETKFHSHYWRGLFDADGYISASDGNGKSRWISIVVSLAGTKELCEGFSYFLDFNGRYVYPFHSIYRFKKTCKRTLNEIYFHLYSDANICLKRKRTIFEQNLKK